MIEIKHKRSGALLATVECEELPPNEFLKRDIPDDPFARSNIGALAGVHAHLITSEATGKPAFAPRVEGTVLSGADLSARVIFGAHFKNVNLSEADLRGSRFIGCTFFNTDFARADLTGTIFISSIMTQANLAETNLCYTSFLACLGLEDATGLDEVVFQAPCYLDHSTLRENMANLPISFLRGVGYNDEEIDTLRGLYGKAFRFYSCFISYAHDDGGFASRLYSDLQANNVTCWKDTEDMKGGDYWRSQITEAIRLRDKLVVICSENSVTKPNVIYEIVKGIEHEEKTGEKKLFPIRIDDFLFTEELKETADRKTSQGDWPRDWIAKVRAYHVSDFRGWKDHDKYQKAFEKLVRDLKQPAKR